MSAATKPRASSRGLRTTRPDPTRLAMQTARPFSRARSSAVLERRRPARSRSRTDDPARAGGRGRVDHRAVGADVRHRDVHTRQISQSVEVEVDRRGVDACRGVVEEDPAIRVHHAQRPDLASGKALDAVRRCFGDVAGGVDGVVEDDQNSHVPGVRGGSCRDRVHEVQLGVGTRRRQWAHRTGHDHGLGRPQHQMEKVRRLLERVRPVAPLPGPALTGSWVGAPGSPGGA